MLTCKPLRAGVVNLVLLQGQVYFVASQRKDEAVLVSSRVRLHLAHPVFYRLERTLTRQIVADNCADGVSVVHVDH